MTPSRDDVIRMAREAGLTANSPYVRGKLERFAALVVESAAAAERRRLGPELLMGDCMAMVHQDLIDAGLIGEQVPPMMIPEAIARRDALATARVIDAIVAEREACANACRDLMDEFDQEAQSGDLDEAGRMHREGASAGAKACEAAIRARSTKP